MSVEMTAVFSFALRNQTLGFIIRRKITNDYTGLEIQESSTVTSQYREARPLCVNRELSGEIESQSTTVEFLRLEEVDKILLS